MPCSLKKPWRTPQSAIDVSHAPFCGTPSLIVSALAGAASTSAAASMGPRLLRFARNDRLGWLSLRGAPATRRSRSVVRRLYIAPPRQNGLAFAQALRGLFAQVGPDRRDIAAELLAADDFRGARTRQVDRHRALHPPRPIGHH